MNLSSAKNDKDFIKKEKKISRLKKISKDKTFKESGSIFKLSNLTVLQDFFKDSNDIVWICNLNYKILYVSDAIKQAAGITPSKLTGEYLYESIFCGDKSKFKSLHKFISKHTRNKSKIFSKRVIHHLRKKNNLFEKAETEISSLSDKKKKPVALLGITRIVKRQNQNEDKLRESNLNLTLAQQLAHLGTYQFDQDGNNNQCSSETAKIFELNNNRNCLSIDDFYSIIHPDDNSFVKQSIVQAIKKNSVYDFECRILLKNNKLKYLHIIGKIVGKTKKSSGKIFGIVMDITEQKKSEENLGRYLFELKKSKHLLEDHAMELASLNEQLKAASKELSSTNEAKDKFFSILAHDLRSPFHGLLGFSNMLTADYDNLSDTEKKNIAERINLSAHYVFKLIENLLEWSRLQSGRMEIKPLKVELKETVLYIFNLLTSAAGAKQIRLINEVDNGLYVYADQNMLNSVIENLLSNAIKFSRRDSDVVVSSSVKEKSVAVSIKDSGIGIKNSDIEKLFKIDIHHSTPGTEEERGTGLGLILCKEMIEKMGGEISVISKEKEGSVFTFTVPAYL